MFLYSGGPLTGLFSFNGPCHAARQAGVAAHARHGPPGRANTGTVAIGPCRVWAGPKKQAFVLRAAWTSIVATHGLLSNLIPIVY